MRRFLCGAIMLIGILLCTFHPAHGANLLVNPGFEANSGHAVPTGWTYFSAPPPPNYFGNYWVESAGGRAHSGSLYWKEWGALYNAAVTNVAGIYQDFSSAAGSTYQANGWFYTLGSDALGTDCYVWIEVSFLGPTTNLLALYKSANFYASVGFDNWFQYQVTNACDISVPVSIGDPYFTTYAITGSVSQLQAPIGTTTVRYRFAYAQAGNQGGSCYFDDAVLNQIGGPIPPVISNLLPLNMLFANPNDGLTFNVSSPSGFTINNSGIRVILNGSNVSAGLQITGSSSNKNVAYQGLQSNLTYTASITVTDAFGFTASANTYFETTWVGIPPILYLWEAEDFDFSNGLYVNSPNLCNASGDPNCYYGKVGVEGVDEHNISSNGSHLYRPDDPMRISVSGDYLRKNLHLANRPDYRIDPFQGGEWINYTRDWSNSTYWVVGRLATGEGLSGSLTLSLVNPDTSTTDLGTFNIQSGLGWSTYQNVFLRDTNGNLAIVTLNGKATLRITSGGNLLPNFFGLVAGQVDLPQLSNMYPTGTRPFENTNALSFTVTTVGATFPADGIKLSLNGVDVSSNLVISGTASTKNVVLPSLQPNAIHLAIITATNSLSHGIRVTNQFDTFNQNNYMVEAEDFDYGGGQFIADWQPEAYSGLDAMTNIDFAHIPLGGESYPYRTAGIPESSVQNYTIEARQVFVNVGAFDYQLDWFGSNDWANYTRVYPTGTFYAYVRSSGLGNFTMYLDQVVSGKGTTNQVTKRLGRWSAVGVNSQTYGWVPLTDDGLIGPLTVKLGGTNTLRITTPTGLCYPNYFMLVPASGITLTGARSGNSIVLSFPTQAGTTYRVLYRNSLNTSWNVLAHVLGNGSSKTVSDSVTGSSRFYQVVSP